MNKYIARETGAKKTIAGVVFHCWQTGIGGSYEWRSADGRMWARGFLFRKSFEAGVDGKLMPTRFRSLENAMRGAIQQAKKNTL